MVLRKTDELAFDSYRTPPASASMQPPTGQQRTLQSDIAALHLDPPARVPTPPPDSDHEDSSSDWDASEREDEGDDHHQTAAGSTGKPLVNSNPGQPPSHSFQPPLGPPPSKPPALNVSLGGSSGPEDELVRSPWADNDGMQSATSTRTNNNPFRRPGEQTPIDKASKHASVWNALHKDQLSTHAEDPHAQGRVSPVSHSGVGPSNAWGQASLPPDHPVSPVSTTEPSLIDLDPSNPWDDDATGAAKGKAKAPALQVDSGNPWDDSTRKAQLFDHNTPHGDASGPETDLLGSDAPSSTDAKSAAGASAKAARKVPQQRNEIYQVKRIKWLDPRHKKSLRESPILVQNANGPCPLLALVNALALSTPPDLQTELIRTLQRREQISLGLLIDAVFEELMSGRRGSTAQELPDVSELYAFLVTLHTGMNVNPKFVAGSTPHMPGVGTFEPTTEMKLYSTFAVPLVHGWVPAEHEDAYAAFSRTAPSYEDAQNVQFREEEIEQKLGTASVTQEEQNILLDLTAIKDFFTAWPTQLTEFGLESIKQQLAEGSVSILFRNDHFSTIYKEPKTKQIMTLMTDAGYASHEEVVWESLVDISGTRSEMFSGDFRCVSHDGGERDQSKGPSLPARKPVASTAAAKSGEADTSHTRSQSEQEDHDLALALQLQEEEDQRHRSEQAARRRENELSQQYLSGDTPEQRPAIPPRRSNRPPTHRPEQGQDPELPTYEEAQAERPYRPGQGPPPHADSATANSNAYYSPYTSYGRRRGRTQPSGPTGPFDNQRRNHTEYESFADRREGCILM